MADFASSSKPTSSTAMTPAGVDNPTTVRPRNRKGPSSSTSLANASELTPVETPIPSRGVSPMPAARLTASKDGRSSPSAAFSRGLLEGSWAPAWASVQDFATTLLDGGYNSEPSRPSSRAGSKPKSKSSIWKTLGGTGTLSRKTSENWGPAPPSSKSRPSPDDIAAGSLAEREAQLKARRTASVLESHDGVNGGLDVTGRYKKRNSDENARSASQPVIEEHLVYLHHVQPTDTYAGIVLRYRCLEHAFRKINGLWSRDNIQIRKHLFIPVDACEVKGRPCDPPAFPGQKVDLLAPTPQTSDPTGQNASSPGSQQPIHDDYFSPLNGRTAEQPGQSDEDQPWTHVRWVRLDSLQEPVEIVRVRRTNVGYFPPRRKKSLRTVSAVSTPRHSLELSKAVTNVSEIVASPSQYSSRRQSSTSGRPTAASLGSPSSVRSRGNSIGQDGIPAWMRRPGGVGSMGRSVKAPGPARDSLNTWVNKRLPGFNIDNLPSMSIMGSETAHFGFNKKAEEGTGTGIVESPYEEGRDATVPARNGIGLEQAAASIETWLRGAWVKGTSTPKLGSQRRNGDDLDLIELTDTNSDDGRSSSIGRMPEAGLLNQDFQGSTGRNEREGTIRGRSLGPADTKGKKAD